MTIKPFIDPDRATTTNRIGELSTTAEQLCDELDARVARELRTNVRDPDVSDSDWLATSLYPLAARGKLVAVRG